MHFQPSPEVPALQYVGSVEEKGAAAEAGLKTGDFIIEVRTQLKSIRVHLVPGSKMYTILKHNVIY